ncbi:hypothetical protein KJ866_04600, partial [Patescibacteria group bacterium]|nr:hypothetical protein [Patescibacteria group bacterium]
PLFRIIPPYTNNIPTNLRMLVCRGAIKLYVSLNLHFNHNLSGDLGRLFVKKNERAKSKG